MSLMTTPDQKSEENKGLAVEFMDESLTLIYQQNHEFKNQKNEDFNLNPPASPTP
jgi:hypothetical protein